MKPRPLIIIALFVFVVFAWEFFPRFLPFTLRATRLTPQAHLDRDFSSLSNAIYRYFDTVGRFPSAIQGLTSLINSPADIPNWHGPYLPALPLDPWGHPYSYVPPTDEQPDIGLTSNGPDGIPQTADDIRG